MINVYFILQEMSEMDEKHREVLLKCHDYLIENITPMPLLHKLLAAGIITKNEHIRMRKKSTDDDRNELLLEKLPRAGPEAFSSLLKALKEIGQSFIAEHLLKQLETGTYGLRHVSINRFYV